MAEADSAALFIVSPIQREPRFGADVVQLRLARKSLEDGSLTEGALYRGRDAVRAWIGKLVAR